MLYVPGDKPRALEKARTLPVDGVIFDLEDSVAPEAKDAARAGIAAALAADWGGRELILRVSAADCAADFDLAGRLALDGVLLPKVEHADTVAAAAARTRHPLWCMIETPLGVLRAAEIAGASDRLAGFVVGSNDLVKDLRARHVPDRTPILTALSLILLAARAHGLAAIDGVHLGLDDMAGLEDACRQGRDLGFDGKTLVHPAGIAIANRVFGPDADEVAQARRIIAAWAEARAAGKGVARIDGQMVEQLHVDQAEALVALAEAVAAAAAG
jgi:citrate lyase subunit beta/citryl-CoA lyase